MSDLIQAARAVLLQYEKTRNLELLRQAGEKLEGVDLFAVAGSEKRAEARMQTATAWMAILSRIDAARDPRFNPDDPPVTRVAPPKVPGGPAYLPGVDPKQVRDPKVRAEYERAIEENRQKAEIAQRHWELEAIDTEVTEGTMRFLKRFYTSAPTDQRELRSLMERTGLSARRCKAIDAIYGR